MEAEGSTVLEGTLISVGTSEKWTDSDAVGVAGLGKHSLSGFDDSTDWMRAVGVRVVTGIENGEDRDLKQKSRRAALTGLRMAMLLKLK